MHFSPASVKAGASATITIAVARTTMQGTYTITIRGTDAASGLTHTTTIRVTVRR